MGDMKYIFEIDQIENLYMLPNASTFILNIKSGISFKIFWELVFRGYESYSKLIKFKISIQIQLHLSSKVDILDTLQCIAYNAMRNTVFLATCRASKLHFFDFGPISCLGRSCHTLPNSGQDWTVLGII